MPEHTVPFKHINTLRKMVFGSSLAQGSHVTPHSALLHRYIHVHSSFPDQYSGCIIVFPWLTVRRASYCYKLSERILETFSYVRDIFNKMVMGHSWHELNITRRVDGEVDGFRFACVCQFVLATGGIPLNRWSLV